MLCIKPGTRTLFLLYHGVHEILLPLSRHFTRTSASPSYFAMRDFDNEVIDSLCG